MSTSIFHEPESTLKCIKVQCSMNERRAFEERSVFFIHPLFDGETEWPLKTDIVCRYDGEKFDTIPIIENTKILPKACHHRPLISCILLVTVSLGKIFSDNNIFKEIT